MNHAIDASHPLRVALYARFSSENQRDASIEDQIRICRSRADREGWSITETFTDYALSGSTTLRPGYQALMSAIRSGHAPGVGGDVRGGVHPGVEPPVRRPVGRFGEQAARAGPSGAKALWPD
ncbi:recombinase family protein [Sediminicoccus sp. KRV36]|uniref:recombinase family protein n=1 Tax=Sediminicoccus sp. KRV36 TaxID=3133721 RepID=UPI0020103DF4|nr:recombinase family protein [Sediminicoccus rosea]UPY36743.1 recombinase family protein [Sediminicoccus rosea]